VKVMLKRVVVGSAIAAASWYAFYRVTRWRATWGIDPAETEGSLPGDDLVPEPAVIDTRGITIDAPPAAVWPWLLQLGYGRGGWYSYDQLDMKGRSADAILPEHQSLAVGDIVPTDPAGGFEVKVLDPERALVLMVDDELVARRRTPVEGDGEATTAGLEASGRFMQASMPPRFAVSWAFVLRPLDGGRTRLVERMRGSFGEATAGSRTFGPLLGFGIFVMTRRQMLGLKARVERHPTTPVTPVASPASGNGHAPADAAAVLPSA
jgi:hypothetical protein